MFTNIFQEMFHNKIICFLFSKIPYNLLCFKDDNLDISPCLDFIKNNGDKYSYYKLSLGFIHTINSAWAFCVCEKLN